MFYSYQLCLIFLLYWQLVVQYLARWDQCLLTAWGAFTAKIAKTLFRKAMKVTLSVLYIPKFSILDLPKDRFYQKRSLHRQNCQACIQGSNQWTSLKKAYLRSCHPLTCTWSDKETRAPQLHIEWGGRKCLKDISRANKLLKKTDI